MRFSTRTAVSTPVLGGFCTPVFGGFSGSSPSGAEKAEFRNAKRGTPFFVSYMLFFSVIDQFF